MRCIVNIPRNRPARTPEKLGKLIVDKTRIAIRIDSPDDRQQLYLGGVVRIGPQECPKVYRVDLPYVVTVDGAEGREGRVVIGTFQLQLQDV